MATNVEMDKSHVSIGPSPRNKKRRRVIREGISAINHLATPQPPRPDQETLFGRVLKGRFAPRFSLQTMFLVVSIAGVALAFSVQQRSLTRTQSALSRYESELISTSLQSDQFRIITRPILDLDSINLVTYRIEVASKQFVLLEDGLGGYGGATTSYDHDTNLHWTEAVVLIDHIKSEHRVKVLAKLGGASGYTVISVPEDFSLSDSVKFNEVDGIHEVGDRVELFQLDGKPYTLRIR